MSSHHVIQNTKLLSSLSNNLVILSSNLVIYCTILKHLHGLLLPFTLYWSVHILMGRCKGGPSVILHSAISLIVFFTGSLCMLSLYHIIPTVTISISQLELAHLFMFTTTVFLCLLLLLYVFLRH
jgi:hypothetical protein